LHQAKPREVLDRCRDVCLFHARDERAHLGADPLRIRAIAATELRNRLIPAAHSLRHDIGDGRQIGIDADSPELAPPSVRLGGQGAIVVLRLVDGSRDGVESGALQPLNQAAFLIDGQQRLCVLRRPGGPTSSSSDVSNHRQGGRTVAEQEHAASPSIRQDVSIGGGRPGRADPDHQQLPNLCAQAHRRREGRASIRSC
jgi:hypothetical protein